MHPSLCPLLAPSAQIDLSKALLWVICGWENTPRNRYVKSGLLDENSFMGHMTNYSEYYHCVEAVTVLTSNVRIFVVSNSEEVLRCLFSRVRRCLSWLIFVYWYPLLNNDALLLNTTGFERIFRTTKRDTTAAAAERAYSRSNRYKM